MLRRVVTSSLARGRTGGSLSVVESPQQVAVYQCRSLSDRTTPQKDRKNFLDRLKDSFAHEYNNDPKMKESIDKFRQDKDRWNESDSLKKAREKYDKIGAETVKTSQRIKDATESVGKQIGEKLSEAQKLEFVQKSQKISADVGKSASDAAQRLANIEAMETISKSARAIRDEVNDSTASRHAVYQRPTKPLKRSELALLQPQQRIVEANEDAQDVTLHKDSKWFESWSNFRDNNAVANKVFDLKMQYDESDNLLVRVVRSTTEKISTALGGMFQQSDLSEVLTEIGKVDSAFDREDFLKFCQKVVIPNFFEAVRLNDLEVLEDWTGEAVFGMLSKRSEELRQTGRIYNSQILDVNNLDLIAGKMMDQGPVLIIMFSLQEIEYITSSKGDIVEGSDEQVMRANYVWALSRDLSVIDPFSAWRLLEMSSDKTEQFL